MFDPFSWLRRKASEAVIGGVSDALTVLTPPGETPPTDLEALRLRLAAAVEPRAKSDSTALPPATTPATEAAEDSESKSKAKKK